MRFLILALLGATSTVPLTARADRAAEATRILGELEAATGDAKARLGLIEELAGLAPTPTATLEAFLKRERKTSAQVRGGLLKSVGAAVPNDKGQFRDPGKEAAETLAEGDKFDWAAKLAAKSKAPGLGETLADVAAIRALARSEDPAGALVILRFTFKPEGVVYRDEVGRYLRLGEPYTIPGLIRGINGDDDEVSRYATYQIERIDRQAPHKAMRASRVDEALSLAILEAYGETLHREAIYVILDLIEDPSLTLRTAARKTWMEFVTRKPKNPAPRRRLSLPGGGYTKGTTQLYFDHQELAAVELRKRVAAITGAEPGENVSLEELTKVVFASADKEFVADAITEFDAARRAAASGDLGAASSGFDRVLAADPSFDKKAEMAETFLAHGKALLAAGKFDDAGVALRKAYEVDPEGPSSKDALAQSHVARARIIEAAGGDSSAELAKAIKADPGAVPETGKKWMMFLGIGAALAGLFLLLAGAFIRSR